MTTTLAIKDYESVFYLAESFRYADITWTRFPVARNSTAYRRLMQTAEGRTAYCVFVGVLRLVSRNKTGGVLVVKGLPMTAADVASETGLAQRLVERGMDLLQHKSIGWLVPVESPGEHGATPGMKTGNARDKNGQRPGSERAEPRPRSRGEKQKKKNTNTEEVCAVVYRLPAPPERAEERSPEERRQTRRMLEAVAWTTPDGGQDRLHSRTIDRLCDSPHCTVERVWVLARRLRDERPTNPATWLTAAIEDGWGVSAADAASYARWRAEHMGAVDQINALRRRLGGVSC